MSALHIETLSWRETLRLYRDRRMVRILVIGAMSGLPHVAILSMMTLWLQEYGLSRTGIGFFGLVLLVYAFNFAWAPLVDAIRIPGLTEKFGTRRAWIVLMQTVIAGCLLALSFLNPADHLGWVALWSVILAAAGATQDVAIDALRIEQFREDEPRKVGAGSAMAVSGWWIGYGIGGGLALKLVDTLQHAGVEHAWQNGYLFLILITLLLVGLFLWLVPERRTSTPWMMTEGASPREFLQQTVAMYVQPIANFVVRYGARLALFLLLAIFLFKVGEAFLGRMSLLFYTEIGFSKSDIALFSKGYGTITIVVFAVLGSLINARYGLLRGLIVGGVAMALTNLLFAVLAHYPSEWLFAFAVITDQFTTAISSVAFVAFLSQLCDRNWTATQYAALASLGNLSRTLMAAWSGVLVDGLGGNWSVFFVITSLMVLPSLLLILMNRRALLPFLERKSL